MSDALEIDVAEMEAKLKDWLAELDRLSRQSAESRAAVELDQTRQGRLSRQDALMQQEMAKETERRRALDRKRILAAFERIKSGDYGYCVRCDEPIVRKRLELDPAAPLCVDCAGGGKEKD